MVDPTRITLAHEVMNSGYDGWADASLLEDEIERLGIQERYIDALINLVASPHQHLSTTDLWRLIHATPEQRAWAFLEAIKVPA